MGALDKQFYAGNHTAIVERFEKKLDLSPKLENVPFLIGSYSFLGKLTEAENLFKKYQSQMIESNLYESRFFLGVNFCRNSQYDAGLEYLNANLGNSADKKNNYYAHQGAGFYRYLTCEFEKSLTDSEKALECAIEAKFPYGIFLAKDLLGHSLIYLGKIREGLERLYEALDITSELGNGGLRKTMELNTAVFEAQFGIGGAKALKKLEHILKNWQSDNNYSRSFLQLELARQYFLLGRRETAEKELDDACRCIYRSKHKRLGVMLNLSYAYLAIQKREFLQALNLVRNASQDIDPKIDKTLKLKAIGLEKIILDKDTLLEERELVEATHYHFGKNILERESGHPSPRKKGEDILGDLVDEIGQKKLEAIPLIQKTGYWGLLPKIFTEKIPQDCLLLDFLPHSLIFYSRGEVRVVTDVPPMVEHLFHLLGQGPLSKQKLIEKIWKLEYHPLRHDPLLYSLVNRSRSLMGHFQHWLTLNEMGYALLDGVRLLQRQVKPVCVQNVEPADLPNLNSRQFECLSNLDTGFIDVAAYKKRFKVSQITACRDLTKLTQMQLLKRLGKGRATKYMLAR